jgi:hypothetical protein
MYTGDGQVHAWLQQWLTPEQNVVPDQFQVDGNHLIWRWIRYGDRTRQIIGVPQTTGEEEAIIERGKIAYLRITPNRMHQRLCVCLQCARPFWKRREQRHRCTALRYPQRLTCPHSAQVHAQVLPQFSHTLPR